MFNAGADIKAGLLSLLLVLTLFSNAQDSIYYSVGASAAASDGSTAPFWIHSNRFGSYSMRPFSSTITAEAGRHFNKKARRLDYAFKIKGQLRIDEAGDDAYMQEYYVKLKAFRFLDLTAGARQEYLGCQDSILSSGGLLFSTNSRPMPKITAGIEEYTSVPFTKGYIQIKGALTHGWMNDPRYVQGALLHHKYAYVKLGGSLPVNLHYGLNHAAQWGGRHPVFGKQASGFNDFKNIFFGKAGTDPENTNEFNNAMGNHIVSKSIQLDLKFSHYRISAYWQNIYEDPPVKPMYKAMNAADGLWGVSLKNENFPFLSRFVYEYLNTTDQSGPYHDKDGIIYGGNDCYFYNGVYQSGWSYFYRTIGTPFITPPVKKHTFYSPYNNRTQLHHLGIAGDVYGYKYRFLTSLSKSYGVYSGGFEQTMICTSLLLEVNKVFTRWHHIEIACAAACDIGRMPAVDTSRLKDGGNTAGILFSIRKTGTLFRLRKRAK